MALKGNPSDWETGTKIAVIRDALGNGAHTGTDCKVCKAAGRALYDNVGTAPLIFKTKVNGVMTELPKGKERWVRFMNLVREVHAYIGAGDFSSDEPSEPAPAPIIETVIAPVLTAIDDAKRRLFDALLRLQTFANERGNDSIGIRPFKDGRRMIEAGLSVEACLHACTIHWEDAERRQAGVSSYDPARDFPGGLGAYLATLAKAGVLVMIYGPAGVGKSFWVQDFAKREELDFASMPCTEGATPSWLLGKETMSGFKGTEFLRIWNEGGVFLFDEIDAADPNLLMVINDALANGALFNPVDQKRYDRHPDCHIFAAANTLGTGADGSYTARNQLDFSTLDRFRMGRAFVGFDAAVAEHVMFG